MNLYLAKEPLWGPLLIISPLDAKSLRQALARGAIRHSLQLLKGAHSSPHAHRPALRFSTRRILIGLSRVPRKSLLFSDGAFQAA